MQVTNSSSFIYGQNGLHQSQNRLNEASQKVADASTKTINDTRGSQANQSRYGSQIQDGLVQAKISETDAKANARVIDASNKTIGSLIDIKV